MRPVLSASVAALALFLAVGGAGGQMAPAQITTDTPDYCVQLHEQVGREVRAAPLPPPPDVGLLSDQGQHMCDQGQVRGGIARLRRALVLMHQVEPR
ncbi:MAG: hypothetical protein JO209_04850 [Acidisphaera sp.]|nr:hypothetical protein [Acidisphaera sp.]